MYVFKQERDLIKALASWMKKVCIIKKNRERIVCTVYQVRENEILIGCSMEMRLQIIATQRARKRISYPGLRNCK